MDEDDSATAADITDPAHEPEPLSEVELVEWERSGPGRERHEVAAAIRDDFLQLEVALAMADPTRCIGIIGPRVAAAVAERVEDLRRTGQRQVHGLLEILGTPITAASGDAIEVTIDAMSSLHVLDRSGKVVSGSTDLVRWHQPLSAVQAPPGGSRWVITGLGPLRRVATPTGPAREPLDPQMVKAWERHLLDEGMRGTEFGGGMVGGSILMHAGGGR